MKKIFCLFLSMMLVFGLDGCAKEDTKQKSVTGHLKVYYYDSTISMSGKEYPVLYKLAVEKFQEDNKEVELEAVSFTDAKKMDDQVATELTAGEGPDVILLNGMKSSLDTYKMAQNGAFLDMASYIDEATRRGLYPGLLEAGQIGGKQYLIPLGIDVPYFCTTNSLMEKHEFQVGENYTFLELVEAVRKDAEKLKNNDNRATVLEYPRISYWIQLGNLSVVDMEAKKIVIDPKQLKAVADLEKTLSPQYQKGQDLARKYNTDYVSYTNVFTLIPRSYHSLNSFHFDSFYTKTNLQEEMRFIPSVTVENPQVYSGWIWQYGVVSAKTQNAEGAYKLLDTVMSYPIEMWKYSSNQSFPASVKPKVNEYNLNSCTLRKGKDGTQWLSGALADQMREVLNHADYTISNPTVMGMIDEAFEPYLTDAKSFEECYADLENRLNLYLSEG
jgi:ABC-type glycerol-3-phosphate transport system substrate-binding protein